MGRNLYIAFVELSSDAGAGSAITELNAHAVGGQSFQRPSEPRW